MLKSLQEQMKRITCSKVGHVSRARHEYSLSEGTGVMLENSGCMVRAHRPSPATRASVQLAADADASVSGGIKSGLADPLRYPFC